MNILITGGAGFIGSNLIHYLAEKYEDYNIINLDLFIQLYLHISSCPLSLSCSQPLHRVFLRLLILQVF